MISLRNKRFIITGAAGGIGRAIAVELDKVGAKLVLVDLNETELANTASSLSEAPETFAFDVSKESNWVNMRNTLIESFGQNSIDGVINNAGIAHEAAPVSKLSSEDFSKIMQVNFDSVLYGSKTFLNDLIAQNEAWIVNISSLFGLISIASLTPYCTSKFAVKGFTEGLRMEALAAFPHVTVCCVHPGGINTEIANNAVTFGIQSEADHKAQTGSFNTFLRTSPQQAANTIITGMQKRKTRVLIGADAKLLDIFNRLFPAFYATAMVKFLHRLGVKI